jgi:atypical dual specificity phosphatase
VKIDWIEPGVLAAGGIPIGARDLRSLQEQDVRAVVTLTEHPLTMQSDITPLLLDKMGIVCLHAPIPDQHPPDIETVEAVVQLISQMRTQGRPIYIHCHAGVGRTGTMLHALYIMQGLSLEAAKVKVKASKPSSQFLMLSREQQAFLEELDRTNSK